MDVNQCKDSFIYAFEDTVDKSEDKPEVLNFDFFICIVLQKVIQISILTLGVSNSN